VSWNWRTLARTTPLERVVEVLNQGMLALENALGREPVRREGRYVTAATVLLGSDGLVVVDTTSGHVTVTVPDARSNIGRVVTLKKLVAANNLVVDVLGTDTVEGGASQTWTTIGEVRAYQAILNTATGASLWLRVI